MFNVKMTINGKAATQSNFRNEIEKSVFTSLIAQIKEKIQKTITSSESSQITIDIKGHDIKSLGVNVNGPKEIVDKINKALS